MTKTTDAVRSRLVDTVREVAGLTGAPMVALWLADEEAASLQVAAVSDGSADNHLPLITLKFGQGGVGWVAAERTVLEVQDVFEDSRFVGRDWWRSHSLCSFLGLPVLHERRLLGVLALNSPRPVRLGVADREQLERLVDQAAQALHGMRLEAEAAHQREQLVAQRAALNARLRETSSLLAVARVVSTTSDLTRALRLVCRELGILTGADTVAAYLLDRARRQEVQPVAAYHVPESLLAGLSQTSVQVGELSFRDALFTNQRAVWTDDAPADARFANSLFARFPHRSALVLPLIVDEEITGGFYLVWWERRRQFEYEELSTLEAIGAQVGMLLRNARLREALEYRTARLGELVRINQVLSSSLDTREVLTEIAQAAARLSEAPAVVFYTVDPGRRTVEVRAVSGDEATRDFPAQVLPFGEDGAGWIAANRRVLNVPDIFADDRFAARDWYVRHGLQSFYGMPVVADGALLAVLALAGRAPFQFGAADQELLDNFCRQAGLAVRNAELFAAQRRADALRAVAELANGAAHEINNPLTVVFGRLSMLMSRVNEPDVLRQLEAALDAAYRIHAIIERMKRITRLERADLPDHLPPTLDIERSSSDAPGDLPPGD